MISYPGISVVSYIPGRVRVRVEKLKNNHQFAQKIQNELIAIPVIQSVETKTNTGSVLIQYDHSLINEERNVELLFNAVLSLFPDFEVEKIKRLLKKN
jgi:hypothetical protein